MIDSCFHRVHRWISLLRPLEKTEQQKRTEQLIGTEAIRVSHSARSDLFNFYMKIVRHRINPNNYWEVLIINFTAGRYYGISDLVSYSLTVLFPKAMLSVKYEIRIQTSVYTWTIYIFFKWNSWMSHYWKSRSIFL